MKSLGLRPQPWQDTPRVLSSVLRRVASYTDPDYTYLGHFGRHADLSHNRHPYIRSHVGRLFECAGHYHYQSFAH